MNRRKFLESIGLGLALSTVATGEETKKPFCLQNSRPQKTVAEKIKAVYEWYKTLHLRHPEEKVCTIYPWYSKRLGGIDYPKRQMAGFAVEGAYLTIVVGYKNVNAVKGFIYHDKVEISAIAHAACGIWRKNNGIKT